MGLDLSALENLSPEEREYALKLLGQISQGDNQEYNKFLYEDYEEVPVDIETFLTDDRYLGRAWKDAAGKLKLYPFWLEQLKDIFPTNVDTNYNTLLESGARGIGKAQPLDSLVFAENGYVKMGEIKTGDKIYGSDGLLHKVTHVFPQGVKPICKVSFSDKTSTLCCDEHLWQVKNHSTGKVEILTAKEILDKGLVKSESKEGYKEKRFSIPLVKPIQFAKKETLVSPYIMGCLLGDGCFSKSVAISTADDYIYNKFSEEVSKNNYCLKPGNHNKKCKDFYIKNNDSQRGIKKVNIYVDYIKELGLWQKRCYNKHIPDVYKYNDVESRLALLQGLLDTDGEVDASATIFTTTSKQLAEDVLFIVESLGGIGILSSKTNRTYHYHRNNVDEIRSCRDVYTVNIKLPTAMLPVQLPRKAEKLNVNRLEPGRRIVNIEYVEPQECQCIIIDSEDHLYLTNDLIVTHNSEIACGCVGTYLLYRCMCLKNPLQFFHMKLTEKIAFAFMNIKLELAEAIAIDKFQNTVQMSPWFMSKGKLTSYHNNPYWIPPEPIEIIIGSKSDDVVGRPIYFAFFDEISFIANQDIDKQKQKARDMINTAVGGMFTRFIHNGKNPTVLTVASSKRSEQSFMEEYIKQLSKDDPEHTKVIDKPVWEVKPPGTYSSKKFWVGLGNKFLSSMIIPETDYAFLDEYTAKGYKLIEVPVDFKTRFLDDIDRGLCDYAGISSASSNKYISAEAVNACINDGFKNPFPDILEIGNDPSDTAQYYDFFDMSAIPSEYMNKPLFVHLDMSISGDMTGIAGSWIIGKKPSVNEEDQGKDLFFRVAFNTSIKAPKGRQISFEKNRNFIRWLRNKGFNVKEITSDTFQSYDLQQQLKAENFNCSILSVDRVDTDKVCRPYQFLKNAIYEKRIQMYRAKRLFDEFVDVERNINSGKVDHSPSGHKDTLDAVCGSIFTASKYAAEYAYDYGETYEIMNNVSSASSEFSAEKEQIILNFEEEMKRAFDSTRPQIDAISRENQISDYQYLANGILLW